MYREMAMMGHAHEISITSLLYSFFAINIKFSFSHYIIIIAKRVNSISSLITICHFRCPDFSFTVSLRLHLS